MAEVDVDMSYGKKKLHRYIFQYMRDVHVRVGKNGRVYGDWTGEVCTGDLSEAGANVRLD